MIDQCPVCNGSGFANSMAEILNQLSEIKAALEVNKNTHATMMCDARPQAKPTTQESYNPLRSRAVSLCAEIDWMFKRTGNGGYDFRIANQSAYRFLVRIKRQGQAQAYLERFLAWAWSQGKSLSGMIRVKYDMFDFLQGLFEQQNAIETHAGSELST